MIKGIARASPGGKTESGEENSGTKKRNIARTIA